MVLCVPGSDGCPMTSGLSCCPSCSFGTLNWSPRRRRSRPLLVVENDQELADEIRARLPALRPSGPVSVDAGRGRVLDVLQPYIDDLIWRKERGARRAAAGIAIAVLLGLYECREDIDEDMLLVRMGVPGAVDDLARTVYEKVKSLHLPSLADECPEWTWYEES
jgi:hypothetical protein